MVRLAMLSLVLALPVVAAPENLAPRAEITATSVFSADYAPGLVADGVVPEMLAQDDLGHAWAVQGAAWGNEATLTFEWPEAVPIAEVIYYGRVGWMLTECFRECEVLADGRQVGRGAFEANAGPQRIAFPPCRVRQLALRFVGSYGGLNPGAGEVQVWSESPPDGALPSVRRLPINVAPRATVIASSEHSAPYSARGAVDGAIPQDSDDAGRAWCVDGKASRMGATFTLTWEQPTRVAELDYYGRTAFMLEECWRDYEIRADGGETPLAHGSFRMDTGVQRVALGERTVRSLEIRFLSSYDGANPGAAEIEVYDETPSEGFFRQYRNQLAQAPETSPELESEIVANGLGFDELLVIERRELNPSHVYTAYCEGFRPGGGLYRVPLGGDEPRVLVDSPEGQILDADLDYTGTRVLLSWRKTAADGYHLYSVAVDGSGLRQLTEGAWHDYNACWLPDGGIAFCSTRSSGFALCFTTPAGTLHRMDADGSNVERLSANYVNDFTPSVLPDGKILYSRWEYVDRPAIPIQSLWAINPDGTGLSVFYGNRVLSPASFLEARAVPGTDEVLCTLAAHNGPIRGAVGLVDRRKGLNAQEALRNLTPQVEVGRVAEGDGNFVKGGFESPCPLDRERFLVSGKGTIYLGTRDGRWASVLPRRGGLGWYNPQPIRPRERPPVRFGHVEASAAGPWATLYLLDVSRGLAPQVAPGTVRRVRVIEERAKPLRTDVLGFGFQRPVISCGASYAVKYVWGEAPVAEDGSASFRVPAGVPLYFEALDGEGRAVQRMRSFTHLMPGEVQGCVGCHEPRTETPVSLPTTAVHAAVRDLDPPEWGAGAFDYPTVVQPVLDRYCVSCHQGPLAPGRVDLSGDRTDWFSVSYDRLTRGWVNWIDTRNGQEANILEITPRTWGSPASKLTELLLSGHPDANGVPRVAMDEESRRRVLAWIDLNVPYYSTYEMTDARAEGGRRVYPEGLDAKLAEVAGRRCASCHASGLPTQGYLRLDHPEWNDFLAAPLATEAGGRGSCGAAVFGNRDDPDYQPLLATIEPARERLYRVLRADIPGWIPAAVDRSCL